MSSMIPFKIDKDHDQTIMQISIEDCLLCDQGLESMFMYLNQNNKNSITYINLTKNKLTAKSIRTFSLFLENLEYSKNLETLILDGNVKI